MDPNANLRSQEQLLLEIEQARSPHARTRRQVELIDLRQALYDWIRDGGFEPDWTACPRASHYFGH